MLVHPNINPVAFRIGPLKVHWYGLMYLIGFYGCWWLGTVRARLPHVNWPRERVGDLLFYAVLGVILGGRIGYIIFYAYTPNGQWLEWMNPLTIFEVWDGGMSFHGGLVGVAIAMWWFARRISISFWEVSDFVAVLVPFGLFWGRIGNFINGNLWGKVTDLPWGMVFQHAHDGLPHQPSELYEAFLEGLVMLAALWRFGRRPRPRMAITALFLLLYGVFRFLIEFIRLPDPQLGYLAWGWLTMGQVLSIPMLIGGSVIMWLAYRKPGWRASS